MQNISIPTIHLFPAIEAHLLQTLHSLTHQQWNKPTIAKQWTVKDVAAHLLDGNIRSMARRDNHFSDPPGNIYTYNDLVSYINGINAEWIHAMKRVSPQTLISLLESTGKQYYEQLTLLDPLAPSVFAVSWAGETTSLNWFHIAREYTERWHHQQQILDATGKTGLMTREFYYPVLDTFMMALPYTFSNTDAPVNTVVRVSITGDAGGDWFLVKKENWELTKKNILPLAAQCTIEGATAWKLFTKSLRKEDVQQHVSIKGDAMLAEIVLEMISVMA
jgi:uncharacterized protein (TIGR03083 family)